MNRGLFDKPRTAPVSAEPGDALVVAIGGYEVDFSKPPAVRLAAQIIGAEINAQNFSVAMAELQKVPAAFRPTVYILVDRALYNSRRQPKK